MGLETGVGVAKLAACLGSTRSVDALQLRDQQRYDAKLAKLRAAIDEGDESGVFEGDPFEHVRAKHGLGVTPR